jgi:hypothetical protein
MGQAVGLPRRSAPQPHARGWNEMLLVRLRLRLPASGGRGFLVFRVDRGTGVEEEEEDDALLYGTLVCTYSMYTTARASKRAAAVEYVLCCMYLR